jgi:hypothetical protein
MAIMLLLMGIAIFADGRGIGGDKEGHKDRSEYRRACDVLGGNMLGREHARHELARYNKHKPTFIRKRRMYIL